MSAQDFKFALGDRVQDRITSFKGAITGSARYITGSDQYLVQPDLKAGETEYPGCTWFDEGRLRYTEIVSNMKENSLKSESNLPGKDSIKTK